MLEDAKGNHQLCSSPKQYRPHLYAPHCTQAATHMGYNSVSEISPFLPLLLLVSATYPLMIKLQLQLDATWLGLLPVQQRLGENEL